MAGALGSGRRGRGGQEALIRDGDTIWAPATSTGRAALGILRISGPAAARACAVLTGAAPPEPRRAALRAFRDGTEAVVDRGLVLWFPAPASATGDDLLELHHHGGSAVLTSLARALAAVPGMRIAAPGEFTRRAFHAGKLDLTQVEAVADLVDAATAAQARQAMRQLDGQLGRRCHEWRERLLRALAMVEAEIDFAPDQEVPEGLHTAQRHPLDAMMAEMEQLLSTAAQGERLRVGVTIAVTGAPNVGKSSLVNTLARRDVALVTPIAGTTRDVIEVALDLGGLPVVLLDTAGLRETDDPVEAAGIERARRRAADADLRLLLVEADAPLPACREGDIVVRTKADRIDEPPSGLATSCVTGAGIEQLLTTLRDAAAALTGGGDAALVTAVRHREALELAVRALRRAQAGDAEAAVLAEDLRVAARAVGSITGAIGVEDVLDRIFASFCIGK